MNDLYEDDENWNKEVRATWVFGVSAILFVLVVLVLVVWGVVCLIS